jgi:hypothetical protein
MNKRIMLDVEKQKEKYLTAAVAALALTLSASARDVDSHNDWVMLALGWSNGTGAYTMNKGFVPEFANKGQCQVALARALQKDARLSQAYHFRVLLRLSALRPHAEWHQAGRLLERAA